MNKNSIILTGVIGYICLFYIAIHKVIHNYNKGLHANIIKNISLTITTLCLTVYYYKVVIYNLNYKNDLLQNKLQIIGYSSYVLNLLLNLHPNTTSNYENYDFFGIIGHSLMVYAAKNNSSSISAIVFLIIYFIYKLMYYKDYSYLEIFSSVLLLINYISEFIIEYYYPDEEEKTHKLEETNHNIEDKKHKLE